MNGQDKIEFMPANTFSFITGRQRMSGQEKICTVDDVRMPLLHLRVRLEGDLQRLQPAAPLVGLETQHPVTHLVRTGDVQ